MTPRWIDALAICALSGVALAQHDPVPLADDGSILFAFASASRASQRLRAEVSERVPGISVQLGVEQRTVNPTLRAMMMSMTMMRSWEARST